MGIRCIGACALGVVMTGAIGSQLHAQDTTRVRRTSSDRVITVSKGEVTPSPVRVDTIVVTRTDTIRNTITRVDTVTITLPPPVVVPDVDGPMFWGIYTGMTEPWGNIDRVYTKGFHAGGVLGWESQSSPIGLRLDGAMSQLGKEQGSWLAANQGSGTSLMLHLAGDLKVKPLNFGGWALYGIGGLNYNRYKRIALASTPGNECDFTVRGACYTNANNTSWSDKFGFNFGGGLDFHIGSQDMFLEARYFATPSNGARSWTLPISLGVRYF